ncbi:MAG: hypothetical protein KatS3mg036_0149 [Ignavibacterium sp.]|nr:MAG: hypothetical protein KatS3mg036_0149 [Ignavibacterium sp.]
MRLASLIQKPFYGPTTMTAREVFEIATIGGARALHLDAEIGSIEEGKKADLVLLELNQVHNSLDVNEENLYSSIVYTCDHTNVQSVMINGEWVYQNREFKTLDVNETQFESLTKN